MREVIAGSLVGIIAMTILEDDDMIVQALRAGARGYLVKGAMQREILDLLAAGATTSQIADRLGLSPKTVRNHLSSTFTKIEALDRTQAVLKARAAGLPRARER